jgi:hypothetical protein
MTAKTPANTTRRQRQMAIVPNGGGNMKPKNTTTRQTAGQGNWITVRGNYYNQHEIDQRTMNEYDQEAE